MVKYSYPLVPNSVGWSIINISDRIIVTFVLGSSENGIYAMANKFPNIMNTFSGFFFTAFKENASKVIKKKDYEDYYNNILNIVHNSFITISLLLITIIPFVFNIFIKKGYIEAYDYIPILVIALYYGNMSGFYGSLFVAFKEAGMEMPKEELDKVMESIDFDGNGYIEYEEFIRVTIPKEQLFTEANLKTAFDMFDLDKNGTISLTEFKEILGLGKNKDINVNNELLKEIPIKGNEEINFEQFKKILLGQK